MTKLLVEVECGTEACGDCHLAGNWKGEPWGCLLFGEYLGKENGDIMPPRCASCLAAEQAAKGGKA